MNVFKATLDTRHQNGVIGTVTQFDNATLELQVVTDGVIDEAWGNPRFELIAMKRDANEVREVDQDRFTILSKEDHKVQIELKEQFLSCRGTVKMQLVVKDGSRESTTLFYLVIGQSLDHDIVESHRDVKVLDDLEAYVKQGFDDLAYQEQRMVAVEQSTNDLNETMNANEEERNAAEAKRSKTFETNEANRTQMFNNQVEEQGVAFSNAQAQREKDFSESQQNMSQAFETSQRERDSAFNKAQELNQTTFTNNETKRQTAFNQSQTANQQDFVDNEAERQRLFESNESDRQKSESQRVKNESERVFAETQRAEAEVTRQQKMTEFEEKATQLSDDLDNQVARVDEFVTANEEKLLGPHDKTDYMGNAHKSVKDVNDANVEYILGEVNTVHYEGQHITATDTIEKQVRSAILKGQTLVNLVPRKIIDHIASSDWDGYCCLVQNSKQSFDQWRTLQDLKPNTKYYISCYVETFEDANNKDYCLNNPSVESIFEDSMIINGVGRYQWLSTTKSELTDEIFIVLRSQNAHARGAIKIRDIMIIEYQQGMENWDIPYFEGMQSVKMPVLTTTGKNLFTGSISVGGLSATTGEELINENLLRSEFLDVLKNTTYTNNTNGDYRYFFYDENKIFIKSIKGNPFTTPNNCEYIRFHISSSEYTDQLQIEQGSVATSYEPFKSNILTVNEDVTLRSNGSVYDELDLLTGKLTQRIDEDGSVLTQEVVKTVDLNGQKVYSYDGTTHYSCSAAEGSLIPTLSIDVPTNLTALISRQRETINQLQIENNQLKDGVIEVDQQREEGDVELLGYNFDLDFRLLELECALDLPMTLSAKSARGANDMNTYKTAKTLILAGNYEREDMEYKLSVYLKRGRLTQEEYDELIALMDARELVA